MNDRLTAIFRDKATKFVMSLLFTLFATTSPAQAAVEVVVPVSGGCYSVPYVGCYSTALAGCQAWFLAMGPSYISFASVPANDMNGAYCEARSIQTGSSYSSHAMYLDATCPVPVINPAALYTYNTDSGMCERTVPDKLNITLEIGSEVEPQKSLSFKAVVKGIDGLKSGIPVTLILDVKTASGGHEHGESNATVRPRGGLSGAIACPSSAPPNSVCATGVTSDQAPYIGEAWFTFRAPDPAGTHSFTATCTECTNTGTASVNVKVDKLELIPGSPFYALQDNAGNVIGAVTGRHSDNHYLTGTAIGKLKNFAKEYQKTVNPGAKLYLNDASLIWGGLFDVGSTNWTTPHAGHRRGVGLDIRAANSGPNKEGAVPTTAFDLLEKTIAKKGAKAALHCTENSVLRIGAPCNGIPNNRHFHVDF